MVRLVSFFKYYNWYLIYYIEFNSFKIMIEMKIVKWEKFKMKTRGHLKLKFRLNLKKACGLVRMCWDVLENDVFYLPSIKLKNL